MLKPSREREELFFGGLCFALSWIFPGTLIGAVLSWLAIGLLVRALHRSSIPFWGLLSFGTIAFSLSCYWVLFAVARLSGLPTLAVTGLSCALLVLMALPFALVGILYRFLPPQLDAAALRAPLAWIAIEAIPSTVYPGRFLAWQLGHTQLAIEPFARLASLTGVLGVSFIMVWIVEWTILAMRKRSLSQFSVALFLLVSMFLAGVTVTRNSSESDMPRLSVGIVQFDPKLAAAQQDPLSIERLNEISAPAVGRVDLLVWPEFSVPFAVNESVFHRRHDANLAALPAHTQLLFGVETFRRPQKTFNSAMFIERDGKVPLPYHKRSLIPVGEEIPFETSLPWLRILNPKAGEWQAGSDSRVFEVRTSSTSTQRENIVRIAPLICYEEVVSHDAVEAVRSGAELLVGLSSDEWLGPYGELGMTQHLTIAAFRAIETSRYLLRSSTTGITSVINPQGIIEKQLSPYQPGLLMSEVSARRTITFYVSIFSQVPWYFFTVSVLGLCLVSLLIKRRLSAYSARASSPNACL